MSELIDREATVKQICKMGEMLRSSHDRDVTIAIALFVQDDKSAFPTVDRPHGEWVQVTDEDGDYLYHKCSNCGQKVESELDNPPFFNFCMDCGSDNRKRGEAALKSQEDKKTKKCPICGSDLYEYCFMCCYEGKKVKMVK